MLDVGWTELVVIAIVLIIVVGPKDLPPMLRTFGKMMTKMRGMAGDFRQQFDEALKEADLDDVRKTLSDAQKLNPAHSLREAMNPLRQMGNDIKADLQKAATPPVKVADAAPIAAETGLPADQPAMTMPSEPESAISGANGAAVFGATPLNTTPAAVEPVLVKVPAKRSPKPKVADADVTKTAAPVKTASKKSASNATDAVKITTPRKRAPKAPMEKGDA